MVLFAGHTLPLVNLISLKKMKVEIISRNFIKPSILTPHGLSSYKISSTDEVAPVINFPVILYYPASANKSSTCVDLKRSLEQTLTMFYPLAGRYVKDEYLVDCNDEGVEYVEAKVDLLLTQGMDLKPEQLNSFMPRETGAVDEIIDPLLAIQVTMFKCAGFAIGISVSHRVADAATLCMFLNSWAAFSRGDNIEQIAPCFNSSTFFPGRKLPRTQVGIPRIVGSNGVPGIVTEKFSFTGKAISDLRDKVKLEAPEKPRPSRIQLVFALIWKAIIDINNANHEGKKSSVLLLPVNLRGKTIPPVPTNSCGNLWAVACPKSETGVTFYDLVDRVCEAMKGTVNDCKKISLSDDGDAGQMVVINPLVGMSRNLASSEVATYWFSSWSMFPFYEADFGWGKPEWVSQVNLRIKNVVFLLDDKEAEGIEAWVNLDENDMLNLKKDGNIRNFSI